jgi:DNA polymerase IIIc chi subunit
MKNQLPKIIFFEIKSLTEKLVKIIKTASTHFENKQHILIIVSDEKAQSYVDALLWKEPKFSFLPHSISDTDSTDYITITQKKSNINNAKYVFNLTTEPFEEFDCNIVYELDDYTDKKKAIISKSKFKFYKEKGHLIESR